MIAAERREQAALLEGLSDVQWEQGSLCAGWSVRHVVAHQTMPFRYSVPRFALEMVRSRGRFDRMADRVVRRDAALSREELTAALRDNAEHPWSPPGQGPDAALTHDVVHGLDVTEALGLGCVVPADRLRPVLDRVSSTASRDFFGVDLADVRLRATDLDWSAGNGTPLQGRGQDLILLLTGRTVAQERFTGDGAARVREVTDARR